VTAFEWIAAAGQLLRGRVALPSARVAEAAGLPLSSLRGARIVDARVGPAELTFRLVPASGLPVSVDVLRPGSPVDGPGLRTLLELVSPSFAVERVELGESTVLVFVRLRTFGLAVTLDAWLHRGRGRPTAASTGTVGASAPPTKGSDPAASGAGAPTRR